MTRILGIDPSNTQHAWALVDTTRSGVNLLEFGRDFASDVFAKDALDEFCCGTIAIEMIASYGMAVGAHTFDTCFEIGILWKRLYDLGHVAKRITRVEVKRIVCRRASANDANVRAAIIDRFGGPASIKKGGQLSGVSKDVWAALAVALAAASGEAQWYTPVADQEIMS